MYLIIPFSLGKHKACIRWRQLCLFGTPNCIQITQGRKEGEVFFSKWVNVQNWTLLNFKTNFSSFQLCHSLYYHCHQKGVCIRTWKTKQTCLESVPYIGELQVALLAVYTSLSRKTSWLWRLHLDLTFPWEENKCSQLHVSFIYFFVRALKESPVLPMLNDVCCRSKLAQFCISS